MFEITSKDNARLKHARQVRDGRARDQIFVEGLRLAEEAANANLKIVDYFVAPDFAKDERAAALLEKIEKSNGAQIPARLLETIADTKTTQGIVVLAEKPATGATRLSSVINDDNDLLIVLHRLNNPNNVGAILRTAEAAGAAGAILTESSADAFAPKALRAAMGSAFRLPIWERADFAEALDFCRARGISIVCAELNAKKTYTEIDWTLPHALIIGSEARGLTQNEIRLCDESLRIPMQSPVESLNAAAAAAIVLYEADRQQKQFAVRSLIIQNPKI